MAYNVNWISGEIFIPVSDMNLISGSEYELDMNEFYKEIRRLEWTETEGLWAQQVLERQPSITVSGSTSFPTDIILSPYFITFDPTATRVTLRNSNNNIIDRFTSNGVSVVSTNSFGNTVTSSGGGLTSTQETWLQAIFNRLPSNGQEIAGEDDVFTIPELHQGMDSYANKEDYTDKADLTNVEQKASEIFEKVDDTIVDPLEQFHAIENYVRELHKNYQTDYKIKMNSSLRNTLENELQTPIGEDLLEITVLSHIFDIIIDESLTNNNFIIYGVTNGVINP